MNFCHICRDLILESNVVDHFKDGDRNHQVEYRRVQKFIRESEGVTDKNILSYLIDKYLVGANKPCIHLDKYGNCCLYRTKLCEDCEYYESEYSYEKKKPM